jgi:hypothetical protein
MKTTISAKKAGEENLSVRCYLQVHGLLAELSITRSRLPTVDNRGLVNSFQQAIDRFSTGFLVTKCTTRQDGHAVTAADGEIGFHFLDKT